MNPRARHPVGSRAGLVALVGVVSSLVIVAVGIAEIDRQRSIPERSPMVHEGHSVDARHAGAHGGPMNDHTHGEAPPAPLVLGPQGDVAQFLVECGFSHRAPDDPIVHPGLPGASHLHEFFGATSTDAMSTAESLLDAGDTTCDDRADTAAYWTPGLLVDGELVDPLSAVAYYRPGPGVDPATVQTWPFGLAVVVGDASATEQSPQPTGIVGWHCGISDQLSVEPPTCPERALLALRITFPDCWDGVRTEAGPQRSHMAYNTDGLCPATHPEPVVQLVLDVSWPVSGDPSGVQLTSGGVHSGHADLLNAWEPDALRRHVEVCLNRSKVCGVRSNRAAA